MLDIQKNIYIVYIAMYAILHMKVNMLHYIHKYTCIYLAT